MGSGDQIENDAEKSGGKGKEAAGSAAGRTDQGNGDVKDAGEKVKDAFERRERPVLCEPTDDESGCED